MDRFQKFRDAAIQGIKELEELSAKKTEIESQISTLKQLISANIAILPASERSDLGLKFEAAQGPSGLRDAVKKALTFFEFRSATEVRDLLINSGYDLSEQVNPLASIHTTLRRLFFDKEIEGKEINGRMAFRRKGPQIQIPPKPPSMK